MQINVLLVTQIADVQAEDAINPIVKLKTADVDGTTPEVSGMRLMLLLSKLSSVLSKRSRSLLTARSYGIILQ